MLSEPKPPLPPHGYWYPLLSFLPLRKTFKMDISTLPPEVLASYPVDAPPPGITSNFDNPESQAHIVATAIYATLPLTLIIMSMAVYSRLTQFGSLKGDDCEFLATATRRYGALTSFPQVHSSLQQQSLSRTAGFYYQVGYCFSPPS